MNIDLKSYYAQRAEEYEKVYLKPERQQDLYHMKNLLKTQFAGHHVVEVACGTGYWTHTIAETAMSILATDSNKDVIAIAKTKGYHACQVSFALVDAYALGALAGDFTAGFCGFWFSHVPTTRRDEFLRGFHATLSDDALVLMIDSRYVEGSSIPLSTTDKDGNTYQLRHLDDGSMHKVLKNFFTAADLEELFTRYSPHVEVIFLDYFWIVTYHVRNGGGVT